MANRAGQEGEQRMFGAVAMWLRRQIETRLPGHCRGIHAPRLDQGRLLQDVQRMLQVLADDLALEVQEQAKPAPMAAPVPASLTSRLSVMDNDIPCDKCKVTRRVAIIDYQDGEVAAVECEACAPEFTKDQR